MNAVGQSTISVIIPARNEEASIGRVVADVRCVVADAEIIVVNDASTDATAQIARNAGAQVIDHAYSKGNGAAIKSGVRAACGEWLVFMDGDGQHEASYIEPLLQSLREGNDLVVGARKRESQAGAWRHWANTFYNMLASWIVGHRVRDLTSGFRAARADRFKEFLFLLPNGFSYPTTSTMAFFRSGYSVDYIDIRAHTRSGKSHVKIIRDGVKFLLIIFRVCTLYSPLKLFFPVAMVQFLLGVGYYLFTFIQHGRFTNMSALLLTAAMTTLLIGLVSEQITALLYKHEK